MYVYLCMRFHIPRLSILHGKNKAYFVDGHICRFFPLQFHSRFAKQVNKKPPPTSLLSKCGESRTSEVYKQKCQHFLCAWSLAVGFFVMPSYLSRLWPTYFVGINVLLVVKAAHRKKFDTFHWIPFENSCGFEKQNITTKISKLSTKKET